jgi:RNA polymerase sigma factor (sigma-70 family)
MAAAPEQRIVQLIGALPVALDRDVQDVELLRRFAASRDESAFAALLNRHGPMVLGVCRRVLGEDHAAEDAFQATFLLLARKAFRLTRPGSLAGWLHMAARRTANQARRTDLRRRRRETGAARSDSIAADDLAWREVQQLLDAELARLPEHYRTPLILCYLNGLSQAEAARQLGWNEPTMRGRLERGRLMLRRRLTRLGLPPAALLVPAVPVSVSAALRSTTLATVRAALSGGDVPPAVAALMGGSSRSVVIFRWAVAVAALLITSVVGLAIVDNSLSPIEQPSPTPAVPIMQVRAKVDLLGDPLPPDALRRLGTLRHRHLSLWYAPKQLLPDGKIVVTTNDQEIRWVDMTTGKLADSWPLPKGHQCRGLSPDGRLALLFDESAMSLWDLTTRKQLRVLRHQANYSTPTETYFSQDGKLLAVHSGTGHVPGLARVFDIATGRELWHAGNPGDPNRGFWPLGFLNDNKTLVGLDIPSNEVLLRDRQTGKVLRSFATMPRQGMLMSLLSPDGKTVFQGTIGPAARAWDVSTGKEMPLLGGHKGQAVRVAISRDGRTVLTGGSSSSVFVWDWPAGKLRKRIDIAADALQALTVSADGRRAEVILLGETALRFYDLQTGQEQPAPTEAHRGPAYTVTVTPDGRVFSAGMDGTLREWDLRTGRHLRQHPVVYRTDGPLLVPSPDHRLLAVSHPFQKDVMLREWPTGRVVRQLDTKGKSVHGLAFSADSLRLAAGGFHDDPQSGQHVPFVSIWDVTRGKEEHHLKGADARFLAFSPDGRWLAGFNLFRGTAVRFWDVTTGKERKLTLPQRNVSALAFTPDGRALASGDPQGITLWELASGKERARIPAALPGGAIQMAPDGRWLARYEGHDVLFFDVRSFRPAHTFHGHDGYVQALAFTPDSQALVSASSDTTLLVWDVAGVTKRLKADPARPDAAAVEAAWNDLASPDAKAAYRAIRLLAEAPRQSLPLLRERLRPAAPVNAEKMKRLLVELGSDRFNERVQAEKELERLGDLAEGALRRLLAGNPPLEVARRAEVLLARLEGTVIDPDQLRQLRAVEVLEWTGGEVARRLLQTLAAGDADARLTREATATLRRLVDRSS